MFSFVISQLLVSNFPIHVPPNTIEGIGILKLSVFLICLSVMNRYSFFSVKISRTCSCLFVSQWYLDQLEQRSGLEDHSKFQLFV